MLLLGAVQKDGSEGGSMLHQYIEEPRVLRGLESSNFNAYLDSFAQDLDATRFAREHVRNQLRGAAHLCVWAEKQRVHVEDFGEECVTRFGRHLSHCRCPGPKRGRSAAVVLWARRFILKTAIDLVP